MPVDLGFVLDGFGSVVLAHKCLMSRAIEDQASYQRTAGRATAGCFGRTVHQRGYYRPVRMTNNEGVSGFSELETCLGRFNA